MRSNVRTAVILYAPEQVKAFVEQKAMLLAGESEPLIIALDKEVEYLLEENHLSFQSGHAYQTDLSHELHLKAEAWTEEIFQDSRWSFFEYRQVPFTKVFFPALLFYVQRVLYFTNAFANIIEANPSLEKIFTFAPFFIDSPTVGYLARRDAELAVECLRLVVENTGRTLITWETGEKEVRHAKRTSNIFILKRALFSALVTLSNAVMRALRPRGTPRVLVSDYWRNIEPILSHLEGGEVILFDRSEAQNAGILNLWRYRMRFLHFEKLPLHREREQVAKAFQEEWEKLAARTGYLSNFSVRGSSVRPLLISVLGDFINRTITHTLAEVDGAYALIESLKPDAILLRVSVSAQTHFATLAYVGKALTIPALELQHGIEYHGPGSGGGSRHTAEYLGVYGRIVQEELIRQGLPPEKLPIIGSPRFDQYAQVYKRVQTHPRITPQDQLRVLCIAPVTTFGEQFDTYAVSDYFSRVAKAIQKIPGALLTIKLRHGSRREFFYRSAIEKACREIPYTIAQYEPLTDLFQASNVVISHLTTVTLEALQCQKPTVVFSTIQLDREALEFQFAHYAKEGAIVIAQHEQDLAIALQHLKSDVSARERMSKAAGVFVRENYAFDGNASERVAEFLKKCAMNTS